MGAARQWGYGWRVLAQVIKRATHGEAALFEDVGVNHGCFDILVAEQLLNRADIVAILQEMGGEAMAEGVAGDAFGEACGAGGAFDRFLHRRGRHMETARESVIAIKGKRGGGEEKLPAPFTAGVGQFAVQGIGQFYLAQTGVEIGAIDCLDTLFLRK